MSNDPLSPARGIANGLLLAIPAWGIIIGIGYVVYRLFTI